MSKAEAMSTLYEKDFNTWSREQAQALREAQAARINTPRLLDWENIAEEIESMGREQANKLRANYALLLAHLLKWQYQPALGGPSWEITIKRERREIPRHIAENPGLKGGDRLLFRQAYAYAREDAAAETDMELSTFPDTCPWTIEQALDPDHWPEQS